MNALSDPNAADQRSARVQSASQRTEVRLHRLRQPGTPREVLRRPRLDSHFDELFAGCPVLALSAAPGVGKTVQAQLYAQVTNLPVAWITLDASHGSSGRLLAELTEALSAHRAEDADTATRAAFRFEATLEEAAALVADSIRPEPALLVIDQCEHLDRSPDALSVIETFLEYCPEQLRVLLLSRTDITGSLQRRMLDGRIRLVDETVLRLTSDENEQLADLLGGAVDERERVFEATGGWTAGAAFSFRYGLTTERVSNDLLSGIMRDVLADLPAPEQQFLLDCSVPDVLNREVVTALCGPTAHALWDAARARHLPATTTTDDSMVYHSLFRAFLHRQLLARDPERHLELVRRYASFMVRRRCPEEATELYLSIEELDQACVTAEQSVMRLCARSDWDTVVRWTDKLGDERVQSSPLILSALVRSLFGQRRFDQTVELVRSLDRRGQLRAMTEADHALLATAAWALQSDPSEARRFLDRYEGDYRADVVRFMLQVCTDLTPASPPLGSDWGDVERIISWGFLMQGRFSELQSFVPEDSNASVVNPNVILAAVFTGDRAEAQALWSRVPLEIRDRPQSHFIEAMLLLGEGELDLALAGLQVALSDSRRTTFSLAPAYEVMSAYLLLQLGRMADGMAALEDGIGRNAESGQTALLEWGQAFLGYGLLLQGRPEPARSVLSECVRSMNRAHRRLFLPFAASCLCEAQARCGDLEASHRSADLSFHTAAMIGSFATVTPVLRAFPEIADREDKRDPGGMRWHRLVVAPSARVQRQPRLRGESQLTLQPFGPGRDIFIDGVAQKIGRMKIIELLAYLVLHPDGADRGRLQEALFPEASARNGGNHFRQISFKFRHITGLSLDRRGANLIGLPIEAAVEAVDIRFEELLRTASWVNVEEREYRLRSALALVEGPYLGGSNLSWAEERRNHLDVVQEEARLELVRLLVEMGRPQEARDECQALLVLNRYSDPGYRLLVHIERTIGSESSVLAAYRQAVVALDELGLAPGDTRRLLEGAPEKVARAELVPGRRRP